MDIEKIEDLLHHSYWEKNETSEKEIRKLAEGLMGLLKWKFELEISWMYDDGPQKIFNFLKTKKRTCKMCVGQNGMHYVWAPRMDRDFFLKYLEKLFYPAKYMYHFEDKEKIIETFEGGLTIKNK